MNCPNRIYHHLGSLEYIDRFDTDSRMKSLRFAVKFIREMDWVLNQIFTGKVPMNFDSYDNMVFEKLGVPGLFRMGGIIWQGGYFFDYRLISKPDLFRCKDTTFELYLVGIAKLIRLIAPGQKDIISRGRTSFLICNN